MELINLLFCFLQDPFVLFCQLRRFVWVWQHNIHCCADGPLVAGALRLQLIYPAWIEACHNGDLHCW